MTSLYFTTYFTQELLLTRGSSWLPLPLLLLCGLLIYAAYVRPKGPGGRG